MVRKFLGGFALLAGLTLAVGCGGSSSAPSPSKEEHDKRMKQNMEGMKGGMPGTGKPAEGAAPTSPMGTTPEKK